MKHLNNTKILHTGYGEFRAKKSMGQNFLKSKTALLKMSETGEVKNSDTIIEIGPGKGALTNILLTTGAKIIAIEKDRQLFDFLKDRFTSEIENKKLFLTEEDILDLDLKKHNLENKKYKIIANIPYNITGAILKKFLSIDNQPTKMVLLVQKEVAERIVSRDGKESILSLSVKAYGEPKYIMKVSKRFFSPSPKVDSAIISINNISKNNFKNIEEEKFFFSVVKAGFSHKRKVLRKNLEILHTGYGELGGGFREVGIEEKARAEDIKIEKWLLLSKYLSTDI